MPAVPVTHKPTCVRIADPTRKEVQLLRTARIVHAVHAPTQPAAPACAALHVRRGCHGSGRQVGIEGWLSTSSAFLVCLHLGRGRRPRCLPLSYEGAPKIHCLLRRAAQLSLLQCAWRRLCEIMSVSRFVKSTSVSEWFCFGNGFKVELGILTIPGLGNLP